MFYDIDTNSQCNKTCFNFCGKISRGVYTGKFFQPNFAIEAICIHVEHLNSGLL
jgi:hypothetical protein